MREREKEIDKVKRLGLAVGSLTEQRREIRETERGKGLIGDSEVELTFCIF